MDISTNTIHEMLERAKNKTLNKIPENSRLLDYSAERFSNHGVWQMFYEMKSAIMEYETNHKEG